MENLYPLTHPQKRIWYVEKTYPGTAVSNIPATVRIRENINFSALEKALNHVVKINEGFRLRIVEQGNNPLQYVASYVPFKPDYIDFSGKPIEELYKWDRKLSRIPLKLLDADLFYFAMFKLNDKDGGYFCNIHHIVSDAWTMMQLLYSQVMQAYRAFSRGEDPEQISAPSYLEFVSREEEYLHSDRFAKDQAYWIDQFTPLPDLVTLQTKKPSKKSIAGRRKAFILSNKETEDIRGFCKNHNITVFSFFLSLLTIYINRITGSEDIVLGTPVLNRTNAREKKIYGMFISTVPLRFCINPSDSYLDYARNITNNWLSMLRHQQYPYDLLQRDIRKNNGDVANLYEITLSYQNAKVPKETLMWEGSSRWHYSGFQNDPLVIHIDDRDDEGTLLINYDYKTNCFADLEIDFIHSHLQCLVTNALSNPEQPICSLSLIAGEELSRIEGFNHTESNRDRSATIGELFEKQVDLTPHANAAIFQNRAVTFLQLDTDANRIAHYLRREGVGRDDIVAVMLPRSIEIISSIFGVVKAGGAFLPLDPTYPEDRIKYMLDNSGAKFVITTPTLARHFSLPPEKTLFPADRKIADCSGNRLPLINKPEDLLYVIYTSGSTGLPKGVLLEHFGLCAFIDAISKFMYFKPGETVLSICTIAFDIFVFEVFPSLLHGMTVVLANETEQRMPAMQKKLLQKYGIVKFLGTPIRMQMLINDPGDKECLAGLKEVMVGGDVFPESLLKQMKEIMPETQIINGYGPTETTIGVAFKNLTHTNEINIGRPIANTKMYILDKHLNMVPIGVPGELYIGGENLARGYLGNPKLTRERFIPDPFNPGKKMYKSGDLARWYPRGDIAFLGRIDSQVKIRGLRVEMGEIENNLRKLPGIVDAVVIDLEEQDKKFLCAYVVPQAGTALDFHILRNELSKSLPAYMVPSYYTAVPEIPLNTSGKADRRALPPPDRSGVTQRTYDEPTLPEEVRLAVIWEQILGLTEVGIVENFFSLGGDSLDVVSLLTAIHTEFAATISISDIYDLPTIKQQAQKINELSNASKNSGSNLIALRCENQGPKLFMVHAGNGEVVNYHKLSQLLPAEWEYYAFRYTSEEYAPKNLPIPVLAAAYLEQLREIQPYGPYFLLGWCIGGTIVFEMARQLEESGETVASLTLVNSLCPQIWENTPPVDLDSEKSFVSTYLPFIDTSLLPSSGLTEFWNEVMNGLTQGGYSDRALRASIPESVSVVIPDFQNTDITNLMRYVNIIRTLHTARALYFPEGQLKARLNFIEVRANDVITDKEGNLAAWQQYCVQPITRIPIEGDHFSIFAAPDIHGLVKAVKDCSLT